MRSAQPEETPEVPEGDASAQRLGFDRVVDWMDLDAFLAQRARPGAKIYYQQGIGELPGNLLVSKDSRAPAWIQVLEKKWPAADFTPVGVKLNTLMAVKRSPTGSHTGRRASCHCNSGDGRNEGHPAGSLSAQCRADRGSSVMLARMACRSGHGSWRV